jgi:16S rRNA (cytosine1402-N4)-methyltransferase
MNTNRAEYLTHDGVMTSEVSDILIGAPKGIFVDATYGYGSHFRYFSDIHNHLNFIGFDRDEEAVINSDTSHEVIHKNFSEINSYFELNKINLISGVFYDFGVSSHQLDSAYRGFSYQNNSIIDMRMDTSQKLSAKDVINNYEINDLISIFFNFGEEQHAKKIAASIIENRPIMKTDELVNVIKLAIPRQNPKYTKSSIRRIFQAIRIEVNNELNEIVTSLDNMKKFIKTGGIMIFLTYHSIEDKIIKKFIDNEVKGCLCNPKFAICTCKNIAQFKLGEYKKRKPSSSEIQSNPRSKSAVLRYMVKI